MRYALSGKIKCYHDGATFVKGYWKSKTSNKERKYWGCSNYRKYGRAKENGCRTPVIHYHEMLDIFKTILKTILSNESEIISDIYKLLMENKSKNDYSKELAEIDKKIEEIKSARLELVNMRARKEIDGDEYLESREKYNKELLLYENKKKSYNKLNNEIDYKSNVNDFIEKIHEVILTDDESIFKIFGSIIDTILVERVEPKDDENHKVILHFKLNILGYNKGSLNLNDFLLLFSNTQGCNSGVSRKNSGN